MKLSMRAVALASSVLWGGMILVIGLCNVAFPAYGKEFLSLVGSIYPGYAATPDPRSVLVGTLYGLADGAIGGVIFAWLHNRFLTVRSTA